MTNVLTINDPTNMIITETGLLAPVCYLPSPHADERPFGSAVELVVIHGISLPAGQFGGVAVEEFFCGKLDFTSHETYHDISHLKVSAHLFIKRTGDVIQFVPFTRRAWHAGVSTFQGRSSCNDFSIGIELEGTDVIAYTDCQYVQLARIIKLLQATYPRITADRIVGHVDIAPGRKTDPGDAFDWGYLKGLIT